MTNVSANVAIEPTERSNPSTVKDTVIPIAITVTMDILRKMEIMLDVVRNISGIRKEKNANIIKIARTLPHFVTKFILCVPNLAFLVLAGIETCMDYLPPVE
jgi:hypothetical protein